MQWTGLNELREKYLSFFESKGHLRLPSFSLVPQGDKSLLLINSGMAPMKKYFTGEITPPRKRVTTCQKCIRTPDIESVGITARHGTYFEMLGNFSFADYFKKEATAWAWEFFTGVLDIPPEILYVSIYEQDDEAFDIWTTQVGVEPSHIKRLGKADNFWEHGAGPCGPCSEIYFDRGEKYGCGSPDCGVGCECDRFIEVWNLVFTQFNNDGAGNYTPLDNPNIDTGMGLERLACVMQGVDNLFEVDTVQNIMKHIIGIAGVKYHTDPKSDISLRIITDHIRSTTFMISDGVLPSNEGRGYVLRRLLRRAARHGKLLKIDRSFLSEVAETVIAENASAYPNLVEKKDFIIKIISVEEENFAKTIDAGLRMLNEMIEAADSSILNGADAFKLSDTFGFPIDLTKEILSERGMSVDEDEFKRLVQNQRTTARAARKDAGADAWKDSENATKDFAATAFLGYETLESGAQVLGVIVDGEKADFAEEGANACLILDKTPFYGEGGGQVGDHGVIFTDDFTFTVYKTTKSPEGVFMHLGKITEGESVKTGDIVTAQVDKESRESTMRNHTAAHLLQAALRTVLGSHVEQAGQFVNEAAVRFDFTHFQALTSEEIAAVEDAVNNIILNAVEVTSNEMPIDEAKAMGAMALFGEKYGDTVRVVKAGDFSIELCGGTHVNNSGKLGLFKIASESSVAAGVRRIEGVTGRGVLEFITKNNTILYGAAAAMKVANPGELPQRAQFVMQEMKQMEREIGALKAEIAASKASGLLDNAVDVGGCKIVCANLGSAAADALRATGDSAKEAAENIVAVFAGVQGEKVTFSCVCSPDAIKQGAHAGNIVREVAKIAGGSGGGKPDSAMAGGKDASKIEEALAAVPSIVESFLK